MRGVLAAAAFGADSGAMAGERYVTPEMQNIVEMELGAGSAWAMRAELGNSGIFVGLVLVCRDEEPLAAEATAYFGGFPEERRPVQVAVRREDGSIERFGPVVSGGPKAGYRSPEVRDLEDLGRFVLAALEPGAQVSNGYRSFWNRVNEARNGEVRGELLGCFRELEAGGG